MRCAQPTRAELAQTGSKHPVVSRFEFPLATISCRSLHGSHRQLFSPEAVVNSSLPTIRGASYCRWTAGSSPYTIMGNSSPDCMAGRMETLSGVIATLEQIYHFVAVSVLRLRLPGRRQQGHEDFERDDDVIGGS